MRDSIATIYTCLLVAAILNSWERSAPPSRTAGVTRHSLRRLVKGPRRSVRQSQRVFKKTAKKLEDKHIPEKVEKKFKKAADKTAEGFGKAERKIKEKLAD